MYAIFVFPPQSGKNGIADWLEANLKSNLSINQIDITNELSSICLLYADDCILYRRIDSLTDVKDLQDDLQIFWEKKVENVFQCWQMCGCIYNS